MAKAALFGAKTVNGPFACKAATRSAARKAATKVLKSASPEATATMSAAAAGGVVSCAVTISEKATPAAQAPARVHKGSVCLFIMMCVRIGAIMPRRGPA